MSSGFGIVLLGVGLVVAFLVGDVVPGMTLVGWIMAFTGMVAITRGDPDSPPSSARPEQHP
jgi:hypothetical protein